MKRSFANKPKSSKIIDFNYKSKYLEKENFIGHISTIEIKRVAQPILKMLGEHMLKLGDVDYTWIQTFPENKNYSITTMFDDEDNIVEWYIDIMKNVGVDEEGIPFYDDLYLDIVVLANGDIFLLDEDELEEAYKSGDIREEEYELARSQIDIVLDEVVGDLDGLKKESIGYLEMMRKNI